MSEHEPKPESSETAVAASETPEAPVKRSRRGGLRIGMVLAVAAAAAVGAWAIVDGYGNDDDNSPTGAAKTDPAKVVPNVAPIGPIGMSASGLRKLAGTVKQPIYWAGPKAALYELTRTTKGKVFVRYLPPNATVGTKKATFLIVASYPFPNALQALRNVKSGRKVVIPGGGIAVVNEAYPQSVHLAYPGANVQVEVFDPSPARALRIAQSGTVQPVKKATATGTTSP